MALRPLVPLEEDGRRRLRGRARRSAGRGPRRRGCRARSSRTGRCRVARPRSRVRRAAPARSPKLDSAPATRSRNGEPTARPPSTPSRSTIVSPTVSTRTARTVRACSRRSGTSGWRSGGYVPYLVPTRLVESPTLGDDVLLKLETEQPTGSFKVRGAFAALTRLEPGDARRDGLGGQPRPRGRLRCRDARARGHRGLRRDRLSGEARAAARASGRARPARRGLRRGRAARARARAVGQRYVSPYNDADVVAGQGSSRSSCSRSSTGRSRSSVPSGGGGLVSGIAPRRDERPGVRVVGVESEASPSMRAALTPVASSRSTRTVAGDGLGGNLESGTITVELVLGARRRRGRRSRVRRRGGACATSGASTGCVVEGSAAIGVGALLAGRIDVAGRPSSASSRACNVDEETLARVLGSDDASRVRA